MEKYNRTILVWEYGALKSGCGYLISECSPSKTSFSGFHSKEIFNHFRRLGVVKGEDGAKDTNKLFRKGEMERIWEYRWSRSENGVPFEGKGPKMISSLEIGL